MNIQSLSSFLVGRSGDHCGNAVQNVGAILFFFLLPRKFGGSWVMKHDEKQKQRCLGQVEAWPGLGVIGLFQAFETGVEELCAGGKQGEVP